MSSTYESANYQYNNANRGRRKHGLAWVPWTALLLLAALAAITYLIVTNVTDENDARGVDLADDEIAATAGNADNRQAAAPNANGNTGAMPSAQVTTADNQNLLQLAQANRLGTVTGDNASGSNVRVSSVVANEGFWVGETGNQLYVYMTQAARGTGESGFQVQAGQRVDMQGVVRAVPANTADLGVTAGEGATQLRNQGGYLEANSVRLR